MKALSTSLGLLGVFMVLAWRSFAAGPVPDKLVVLTFDDSVASQSTFVAPLEEAWLWCHVLHHGGLRSSLWTRSTT
ncbi:MAG: hypothetical protein R3F13_15155 [Prosthecobacter sp.]